MANPTMTLIASNTVGSGGASNVTFSSIPQTYTDLLVLDSSRNSSASFANIIVTFNGSATGYTNKYLEGTGTTVLTGTDTINEFDATVSSTATANTFSNGALYIPNYASSNNKSSSGDGVTETNATAAYSLLDANLWSNTAAITSITLTAAFAQYSTFYLYGISSS